MLEENKIVIVSDDGNNIEFEDITIKKDNISREEVAVIENQLAELDTTRANIEDKIAALKVKIAYAKNVICCADAEKEVCETENEEEAE